MPSQHISTDVIAPGKFPGKILAGSLERKGYEAMVPSVQPKRLTGLQEMVGAAIYLASGVGAYVIGAVLPVDGGCPTKL